jgi:hypothetical protein
MRHHDMRMCPTRQVVGESFLPNVSLFEAAHSAVRLGEARSVVVVVVVVDVVDLQTTLVETHLAHSPLRFVSAGA